VTELYEHTLCEYSATELRGLIRAREVTRVEVVEAHARRIEQANEAVNAFVVLRLEEALAEAAAADATHEQRAGLALDGVPVSVKEAFDLAGYESTLGLPARRGLVAERDEPAIGRLRAAGAIVLGKANTPDLAIRWNTISALFGTTLNPRDHSRSAGGSTGGDAAAVASGMAALGLGADYGGSIRVPATFCEIVGLRPSTGVVPRAPVLPPEDGPPSMDLMQSVGPLARTVDDLELALDVLHGPAPGDPAAVPVSLPAAPAQPGRVALLLGETGAVIDPAVERAVRAVADALRDAGHEVVEGALPDLRRAPELWAEIIATELQNTLIPQIRADVGPSGIDHIDKMFGQFDLGPGVESYLGALAERRALVRSFSAWQQEYPLVLAPVFGLPTPPIDFDDFLSVDATRELFDRMRCVMWVNCLSLPGVALGNGAQLVGRRFRDREVLAAARTARAALGPVTVS
jgi:amidase